MNRAVRLSVVLLLLAPLLGATTAASRKDEAPADKRQSAGMRLAGPVPATVLRVIDGDTMKVEAMPWPGQFVRVSVRLRGIDAPELHSRCAAERLAAKRARAMLESLIGPDRTVALTDISGGKYYGRVLAAATNRDGDDLGAKLRALRLVAAYDGGRRRRFACQG